MKHLTKPVAYLEDYDFDSSGKPAGEFRKICMSKPVVVMVQSSWCGHCSSAKPAFQEFANKHVNRVFCATIQADGERPSEQSLAKRIRDIKPDFMGFPTYLLYVNGELSSKDVRGRGVPELEEFAMQ
jgi:thiol-disulfide isomerase/thioredoxin